MEGYRSVFREVLDESVESQSSGRRSRHSSGSMVRPRTSTIDSKATIRPKNLKPGRSESYPWATEHLPAKDFSAEVSDERRGGYIATLQSASQRGYQAPPRHEVKRYSKKPLPTPPNVFTPVTPRRTSVIPASLQQQDVRNDSCQGLSIDHTDESHERSEFITQNFVRQSSIFMISERKPERNPTWSDRVQKRAESNQRARELLEKRD